MSFSYFPSSPDAKEPTKGTEDSAGYDLYASEDGEIEANGHSGVATGIHISIPKGLYGRIAERSGLALKHSIKVGGGVIDNGMIFVYKFAEYTSINAFTDYRGEVRVILFNGAPSNFKYKKGDRIAQLILERCENNLKLEKVESIAALGSTQRGDGGFGSTGI